MKRFILTSLFFLFSVLLFLRPVLAQEGDINASSENADTTPTAIVAPQFYIGQVSQILDEGKESVAGFTSDFQVVKVHLFSPPRDVQVKIGGGPTLTDDQKYKAGEQVLVAQSDPSVPDSYTIVDRYRLPFLAILAGVFFFVTILVSRSKGLSSFLGLAITLAILFFFILPQVEGGSAPAAAVFSGAVMIAVVSLYVSHGFNKRTTLSLLSTLIILGGVLLFSAWSVDAAHLLGFGSEEAQFLQATTERQFDLRGLLIGGIIIGALGVLDDITTGQTASVEELHKANPKLTFKQLYSHATAIGREHIASLVNTLVLAYAAASLPLLLLLVANHNQPLWVTLNSEFIAEEIVRTLVGSAALVLAVPLSTAMAAAYFTKRFRLPGDK